AEVVPLDFLDKGLLHRVPGLEVQDVDAVPDHLRQRIAGQGDGYDRLLVPVDNSGHEPLAPQLPRLGAARPRARLGHQLYRIGHDSLRGPPIPTKKGTPLPTGGCSGAGASRKDYYFNRTRRWQERCGKLARRAW